uniref:Uncharacterized protein n=1 Tax=Arundo donax TaxID=35708 RepID=A0A0A9G2Z0_ARUDO
MLIVFLSSCVITYMPLHRFYHFPDKQ